MRLRYCNSILAVVIALVSVLGSPMAEAQTDPANEADLEIATGVQTELGPFSIGSNAFHRDLPLISKNQAEAKDVFVELLFVKGPDGVNSEQTDPKVGDKPKELKLDLIKGNTVRPVKISANLPAPGDYEFALLLRGKETKSYRVTVKRDSAQLTLLEMAGGAKLSLESKSSKLVAPLTLRAEKSTAAHNVKVSVSNLVAPGSSASQPKLSFGGDATKDGGGDSKIEIPEIDGLDIASFQLEADLPQSGDYSGIINLSYDGGEKVIPITVKRSFPSSGLDLKYAGVGRNSVSFCEPSGIDLGIAVRESQGESLSFKLPSVSGLTRTIGSTANIAAVPTSSKVFVGEKRLTESGSHRLDPAQAVDIRMELGGLGEPGVYSGKVVIPVEDRNAAEVPVSFSVRRPMIWAVVPILVGVLISFIVRLLRQSSGRLREAVKVLACREALNDAAKAIKPLRPEEQELIEGMRRPLDLAHEDLKLGTSSDANAVIEDFYKKLPLAKDWLKLNRQIADLSVAVAVYDMQAELQAVKAYLTGSSSSPSHDDAKTKLGDLRETVKKALNEIVSTFSSRLLGIGNGLKSQQQQDEWRKKVSEPIDHAKGDIAREEFETASSKIESARLAAAQILAADLDGKLTSKLEWLEQVQLDGIRSELGAVNGARRAGDAVSIYRNALKRYLGPIPRYLIEKFEALKAQFEKTRTGSQDPQVQTTMTERINIVEQQIAALKGVEGQLGNDALSAANTACSTALSEYARLTPPPSPGPSPTAHAAAAPAAGAVAGDVDIPDALLGLLIPNIPLTEEDIATKKWQAQKSLFLAQLIVLGLAMVAATLLGLYVLWGGSASWGSETDIMLALLWGLGLHALTANAGAYAGIEDLASKFR